MTNSTPEKDNTASEKKAGMESPAPCNRSTPSDTQPVTELNEAELDHVAAGRNPMQHHTDPRVIYKNQK